METATGLEIEWIPSCDRALKNCSRPDLKEPPAIEKDFIQARITAVEYNTETRSSIKNALFFAVCAIGAPKDTTFNQLVDRARNIIQKDPSIDPLKALAWLILCIAVVDRYSPDAIIDRSLRWWQALDYLNKAEEECLQLWPDPHLDDHLYGFLADVLRRCVQNRVAITFLLNSPSGILTSVHLKIINSNLTTVKKQVEVANFHALIQDFFLLRDLFFGVEKIYERSLPQTLGNPRPNYLERADNLHDGKCFLNGSFDWQNSENLSTDRFVARHQALICFVSFLLRELFFRGRCFSCLGMRSGRSGILCEECPMDQFNHPVQFQRYLTVGKMSIVALNHTISRQPCMVVSLMSALNLYVLGALEHFHDPDYDILLSRYVGLFGQRWVDFAYSLKLRSGTSQLPSFMFS